MPSKGFVELRTGIYPDHIETKVLVLSQNALEFIFAKESVVYKDAVKPVPNGPIKQGRRHGGIHPSAEAEHDFAFSNLAF